MIQIAFLGAGRMASAIVRGLLRQERYAPEELICTSASGVSAQALAEETGIRSTDNLAALLSEASTLVLACKPQQLESLDPDLAKRLEGRLLLSVLAGTPVARLMQLLPKVRNAVRAMPNTPGQIGAGISAFAAHHPLEESDRAIVEAVLGALGPALELPEKDLDGVTALSGSGPAYVFEFVAALRDGGIAAGLDPQTAYQLALQTTLGSAQLLAKAESSPEVLRDQVVSPGGTTAAGLGILEKRDFRAVVSDAIQAAKRRSIELAASE